MDPEEKAKWKMLVSYMLEMADFLETKTSK